MKDEALGEGEGTLADVRTMRALREIARLTDVGARFVERGQGWYSGDWDNAPGLACESLVIKIGENASRVSAVFQAEHPHVPWRAMKDMRNRLTHSYEATDYGVVWATLEEDFPHIKSLVTTLGPTMTPATELREQ